MKSNDQKKFFKIFPVPLILYSTDAGNIFGIVGWVGTGRVGTGYDDLALKGFRLSYCTGVRIRVDSGLNLNLLLNMGIGAGGVSVSYINFAEAF